MKALLKDRCQNNIAGISTQDKQKTGQGESHIFAPGMMTLAVIMLTTPRALQNYEPHPTGHVASGCPVFCLS